MYTPTIRLVGDQLRQAMPLVKRFAPRYTGRTVFLKEHTSVALNNTNWCEGYRDVYTFAKVNGATVHFNQTFAPWDQRNIEGTQVELSIDVICVVHSYMGTRQSVTIIVHPDAMSMITGIHQLA